MTFPPFSRISMFFPSPWQLIHAFSNSWGALATYGGLLYFGKSTFLSFMSCFHTIRFSYEECTIYVHYYSSLFNGRIPTNIHLFIHVIQSLFFSLFFVCMLVRILSSKIYFMLFFLASFLIALIYYFYMVSYLQGAQPFHLLQSSKVDQVLQSWGAHLVSYPSLKKRLSSLQDFLLACFAGCRDFILEHVNSEIWILNQI